jgi:TfoX/Sxy family transcriptional regulator of competence genes
LGTRQISVCLTSQELSLANLARLAATLAVLPQRSYIQERWVTVPYNAEVAARVRSVLSDRDNVREVKMFGGLAFMVDERMVVCVSGGRGALLVRVAPERDAEYLKKVGAERAEMGKGRSMGEGWITIDEEALEKDEDLQYWMDAALAFQR